jgi:K+-sensing histidine kinase KdpD
VTAARAEKLLTITAAIAVAVTPDEVFEALVDRVGGALSASSVGLWLVDEVSDTAVMAHSYGYSESARSAIERLPIAHGARNPVADSIALREAIWVASRAALIERYPQLLTTATLGRSYRVSALPLISGSRVLGSLGLTIEDEGEATDEEREFLLIIAGYASQALERLRLLDAERRSRAAADAAAMRVAVLGRASKAFVESRLDMESRLQTIAEEIGASLASATVITLFDEFRTLHALAIHHPNPEAKTMLASKVANSQSRPAEGVFGEVARTGECLAIYAADPARIRDLAPEPYRDFFDRYPVHAVICVPVRVNGRMTGVVSALRVHAGEVFSSDDLRLCEELVERAAISLENSRLYEETRAARVRAEQLYRFAQSVVAADRVDTVFDAAIAAIETALCAKRSAILTYDDEGVMRFRAWSNLSDHYREVVEGHSPWPRHATAPEPVLVPNAELDEALAAYRPLFASEGISALAFIPLCSRGRLIGKFMFYYDEPHAFRAHEIETARSIAAHLASVITRFAAFAELEETIRYNELFAGVLAHDLRNPLGAIMTAAQLILMRSEGEALTAKSHDKPLSRILASGRRMTNMIDQLLDLTRARSGGGIGVQPRRANVVELCAQAIGELELAQPDWQIRLETHGDANGSWDPDRLLQVISNLVANAGQHGRPNSEITVKVDGCQESFVTLEVHNAGAIPEQLLPQLFDPFRQSLHRRESARGLGLGLFIVREIVHSHQGTVFVTSSEMGGTTFSVRLPRTC